MVDHHVAAQSTSTLMGARAAGVGLASSALADEWSLFNNVAGLAGLRQPEVSFAYEARPSLVGADRMAASFSSPLKFGAIGLGVFRFGDEVYNEHAVSLGFAHGIGNTSLGARISYVQYRAEGFGRNTAMSLDFGGITRITEQISIGAYITNLTQARLIGTDGERLPLRLVAGLGLKPSDKIFVGSELDKDLDYPLSWRTGVEYSIYKKVFFRTGFNLHPNAACFGLGVLEKKIKFDYAMRFSTLTGSAHQVSVVILFPKPKK
jgi:hypothetical protein